MLRTRGAAGVNPGAPVRRARAAAAVHRLADLAGRKVRPLCGVVDERAIVNATIGLLATGGSTNHAIHIPAMARAAAVAGYVSRTSGGAVGGGGLFAG